MLGMLIARMATLIAASQTSGTEFMKSHDVELFPSPSEGITPLLGLLQLLSLMYTAMAMSGSSTSMRTLIPRM
jgi:hypothetical protein